MEFETQLCRIESPLLTIDIRLGFEGEALVLDGYDIGDSVKKLKGDSDYEYKITVRQPLELYRHLGVANGDKAGLVLRLTDLISGDRAYSLFREYLMEKGVKFETWSF